MVGRAAATSRSMRYEDRNGHRGKQNRAALDGVCDVAGLVGIERPGRPVRTLQNAQARVQVSPMIMKVACFFALHSPMLGHLPSSQMVTSLFSGTMRCVSVYWAEPGAFTRIRAGLLCSGVSGRLAFSGWRAFRIAASCADRC